MALYKQVNGDRVELSASEEQAIRDEWAVEDQRKADYIATLKYRDDRAAEYPEIGDQLDALLKHVNYMRMQGQLDPATATMADVVSNLNAHSNLVQDLDDVVALWLSVKAKYPKPGGE